MAGFYSERMGKSQPRNHSETGSQQKKNNLGGLKRSRIKARSGEMITNKAARV